VPPLIPGVGRLAAAGLSRNLRLRHKTVATPLDRDIQMSINTPAYQGSNFDES
jgi:hypothetical protein